MDFTDLAKFIGFFAFLHFAILIPGSQLLLQRVLAPQVRSPVKDTIFECGHEPFAVHTGHVSVKFYQVAMLFIIFDLELVFLWPWALLIKSGDLGAGGLMSMAFFLGLLTLSYVYAWRKGALTWES